MKSKLEKNVGFKVSGSRYIFFIQDEKPDTSEILKTSLDSLDQILRYASYVDIDLTHVYFYPPFIADKYFHWDKAIVDWLNYYRD